MMEVFHLNMGTYFDYPAGETMTNSKFAVLIWWAGKRY